MKKSALTLVVFSALLSACAQNQVKVDSTVSVPDTFEQTPSATAQTDISQWWQSWHDPVLTQLIENGLKNNKTLAAARANLQAARANALMAEADLGPSVAVQGSAGAHDTHVDNVTNVQERAILSSAGLPAGTSDHHLTGTSHQIGFAASWEPDIFGGKRSDADAAKYASFSVMEAWHGTQILIASDIADNYFKIRALQQRIRIGDDTVATLKALQRYVNGRFKAGFVTAYDVKDVDAKLSAVEAQLATLDAQKNAYQRNIAALTGQSAQGFVVGDSQQDVLDHIPLAPSGQTPLAVLNRRPDVRAQENIVSAFSAKLASAQADLLPRFDINFLWQTGRVSLDSDLPALKGYGGLINAGVTLPIFTAGRIQRNIEASDARLQAALAQYDQSLLTALSEVDSSYQLQYSLRRQNVLMHDAVSKAKQQADDASQLFRYGNMTLDRALNARLTAEDLAGKQVQSKLAEAANMLNLYKALGGGWHDASAE